MGTCLSSRFSLRHPLPRVQGPLICACTVVDARGGRRLVKAGQRPPEGLGLDETIATADADGGLAGRVVSASKPDDRGRLAPFPPAGRAGEWVAVECIHDLVWRHMDSRSGYDKSLSQCSNELLSVQGVLTRHLMQHAREARWQTPVTDAPHLTGRSLFGDPLPLRARRPLFMTVPFLA